MVAIGQGEPFRQPDRRMLGHGVRRRADLREQAGRRRGVEQVAAAAFDHARHDMARGEDMGHHVDVPYPLPVAVGHLRPAADRDPGVRAEQVDRAFARFHVLDQRPDLVLGSDVDLAGDPADLPGGLGRAVPVDVDADHALGAGCSQAQGEGAADASGRSRHDRDAVPDFHAGAPMRAQSAWRRAFCSNARSSARATTLWWTSSGPSASRSVRCCMYVSESGDQWLTPVAPWICMAWSMIWQHFSGTMALAIETQMRASLLPRTSMALAAFSTIIRIASMSMRARETVSMFLPRSMMRRPNASRVVARWSRRSSAFSAAPIERMQWWMRPGPSRICEISKPLPSPQRMFSFGTRTFSNFRCMWPCGA